MNIIVNIDLIVYLKLSWTCQGMTFSGLLFVLLNRGLLQNTYDKYYHTSTHGNIFPKITNRIVGKIFVLGNYNYASFNNNIVLELR